MEISVVDILNTGVTGFAFIMLYLGYRLTSSVQSKILDRKVEDFSTLEYFREWKEVVRNQLSNTRCFMAFASLFFLGGLALLIYQYQAESKIIVGRFPLECEDSKILHQQTPVPFDKGRAIILVKTDHNITVNNEKLIYDLNDTKRQLEERKSFIHTLTKNPPTSAEAGFHKD